MTPLTTTNGLPLGGGVVLLAVSTVFMLIGIAHYRGWQRSGIQRVPFDSLHFLPAWLGAAGVLASIAGFVAHLGSWEAIIVAVPALLALLVTLLSLFWLPNFLLPTWYLDWRGRGRPSAEVASRVDLRYARAMQRRRAKRLSEKGHL